MKLDKKLDTVHSIYIRLRDTDEHGFGKCCTCGENIIYSRCDCSHFIDRANIQFRWDEFNTWASCQTCNRYEIKEVMIEKYQKFLKNKIGFEQMQNMEIDALKPFKMSKSEKEDLLKYRRKQCRDLLKEKNFNVVII